MRRKNAVILIFDCFREVMLTMGGTLSVIWKPTVWKTRFIHVAWLNPKSAGYIDPD
jgi:hypothetical protein